MSNFSHMIWVLYAGLVIFGAAGIHIFSKLGAKHIDPFLGSFYAMAAAFGLSVLCLVFRKGEVPLLSGWLTKGGLYYCGVGLCIALAHLAIFFMYINNAPLSISVPIVRMGAAVIAVLVGVLFLGEVMQPVHYVGLLLSVISLVLLLK